MGELREWLGVQRARVGGLVGRYDGGDTQAVAVHQAEAIVADHDAVLGAQHPSLPLPYHHVRPCRTQTGSLKIAYKT